MSGDRAQGPARRDFTTEQPATPYPPNAQNWPDPVQAAYGDRAPGSGGRWLAQQAERDQIEAMNAWYDLCHDVDFEDWLIEQEAS